MKRFLVLSAILSTVLLVSAKATPIESCVAGMLSGYLDNACTLGDKLFDNFSYSGNVDAASINIDFQVVGTEYRVILAPVTGAGFFTNLSFVDRVSVLAGVAPNIPPADFQIDGVKDQSNFSFAAGTSGQVVVANSPGPTFDLVPGDETGTAFFAPTSSIVTTSTLTGLGGTGSASPGLSSLELGYIQEDTLQTVPEPSPFVLIGGGLLCLGLLRRRTA